MKRIPGGLTAGVAALASTVVGASGACGQVGPRVDFRVLAEFGESASGAWPLVQEAPSSPRAIVQLDDGSVMWDSGRIHWINDDGVQQILAPGTRLVGLPDEDFTYSIWSSPQFTPQCAFRLDDGRAAFQVIARRSNGTQVLAMVLGMPGAPAIADARGAYAVSRDGRILTLASSAFARQTGPLGGTLVTYLQPNMPIGGVAPAGATYLTEDATFSRFYSDGSIRISGTGISQTPPPLQTFQGVYRGGEAIAYLYGARSIPGVSVSVDARFSEQVASFANGSVLVQGYGFSLGACVVRPDGTGFDVVSPSTVLPGYPSDFRIASLGSVVATADQRVYVCATRFVNGQSQQIDQPGLFEYEDGSLRLIVASGDLRLRSPGGQSVKVFEGSSGSPSWISSGGKIAWMATVSQGGPKALVFADRTGVVVPSMWKGEAAPGPLAAFGEVDSLSCTNVSGQDFGRTGSDMPSDTTRLAADGSLVVWVRTRDRAAGRFRMFAVSARLNVCPPDINEDGFIDFFDYDAFLACFVSGEGCGRFNVGDFNQDGFTDFFDYMGFVEAFEVGC
jgi:hypothetical protein